MFKHNSPSFWCRRQDLNLHGRPQDSKSCASANSATAARYINFNLPVKKSQLLVAAILRRFHKTAIFYSL